MMQTENCTGQRGSTARLHHKEISVGKNQKGIQNDEDPCSMHNLFIRWRKQYGGMGAALADLLFARWMLRAYIVWSICADIFLIGGILYLIFF